MNLTNSIYKRVKDIEVYTGFDKVQAIDELGKYLTGSNSMYKELVKPITSGKVAKDIQIKMIASQIKHNMLWEANTQGGKIHVVGKSKYYPMGEWDIKCNSKGEFFEVLTLDIQGKDADIFDKDYLEKRISNFVNMAHEVNLLNNLHKLGVNARGSSDYEDRVQKADLVINRGKVRMGVSVFKSTNTVALDKLKPSNKDNFDERLAYNVYEYGKPSKLDNVIKWRNDCNKGKNKIIIKEDGTKYITE